VETPLFTIGHSNRSQADLLALLGEFNVARVVDVRTVPRSRAHPHFAKDRLEVWLPEAGVEYRHAPALGGLRRPQPGSVNGAWTVGGFRGFADHALTPAFAPALDALLALAARAPTAIMCAEAVWWQCHRRIITDWVLARGVAVVHILGPGKGDAASLTPFARVDAGRVTYPDLMSRG
jgi:uncharacterized protein (DUF488 family)